MSCCSSGAAQCCRRAANSFNSAAKLHRCGREEQKRAADDARLADVDITDWTVPRARLYLGNKKNLVRSLLYYLKDKFHHHYHLPALIPSYLESSQHVISSNLLYSPSWHHPLLSLAYHPLHSPSIHIHTHIKLRYRSIHER